MRPENRAIRYWILTLIVGVAAALFSLTLVVSGNAAVSENAPPPIWHSFRLTDEPVYRESWEGGGVDVYNNYILWSESDIHPLGGGTPSCDYPSDSVFAALKFMSQPVIPPADSDICIYDRQTGVLSRLIDSDLGDTAPEMDGDWIAFERLEVNAYHLVLYNIVTGQEIDVDYGAGASNPAIHGDWVVYGGLYTGQIHAYKLSTGETFMLTPQNSFYNANPDIYEQTVVWNRQVMNNEHDILGYDLSSQVIFTITNEAGAFTFPKIYGDLIVWDWNGDILGYDLSTSQYISITNDPFPQAMPDIYEYTVIWRDGRHGRSDIYGINLTSGETFSVTKENPLGEADFPDIWGDVVAWHNMSGPGVAAAIKMSSFSYMPVAAKP